MKKLLLLFFALLTGVGGAWARTVRTVTLGTQVTDLSTLSLTKNYVLKCVGTSKYNYYNASTSAMAAQADAVYESVVQLNYDGTNVTIKQVCTGTYYQGLVDQTVVDLGSDAVNYTFDTEGVYSGEFRFASNNLFLNKSSNDAPMGASTEFKGNNSRWNIFEVEVIEKEVEDFDPSGKTFTLQCARGYVFYNGSALAGTSTQSSASKFAVVTYESKTYLYDATQKAFVCHTTAATAGTTGNPSLESSTDFSKAVTGLNFGFTGIDAYPYYLEETTYGNWLNMDTTPSVYFNTWEDFESGNGGNTYKVETVDTDFDSVEAIAMLNAYFHPVANYSITDTNGQNYTGTFEYAVGSDSPVPTFTGCEGYTLTDASYDADTKTYSATINFPFPVSSNGVTNQTFIGQFCNKSGYYSSDFLWHANGTSVIVHDGDFPDETSAEQAKYLWTIEPTISELAITFTIKNVATGSYIYTTATSNSHSGAVTLSETATALTYATGSTTNCGTIYMWYVPSTEMYLSVNSVNGGSDSQLGVYNASHDGLSLGFHTYADVISRYWTKSGIETKLTYVGQYGYPTTTEANYSYLVYVKGALSRNQYEGNAANYTNLVTWYNGYLTTTDIVKPATGKFYRFKGDVSARYAKASSTTSGTQLANTTGAETNGSDIFYINGDKIISYYNGQYVCYGSYLYVGENAYTTATIAKSATTFGKFNISTPRSDNGGTFWYSWNDENSNHYIVDRNGSATAGNCDWTVEEVTALPVTISAAKYATLYSPVALTIPSDVTAYVAEDKGEYVTLTAIEDGGVIPANIGVILYAETAQDYNFSITTGGTATSGLTGTVPAISRPADSWVLSKDTNGNVGFYADGADVIPGFKAYLTASGGGTVKAFRFDETAIKAIEAAQNPGKAVYDLNGRRVENPTKGLYIVNGKKYFVK